MGMFKAVVQYFAGAPSPEVERAAAQFEEHAQPEWVPGEPVLSILNTYKANRNRFKFGTSFGTSFCKGSRHYRMHEVLEDTVTGVIFQVRTYPSMYHSDTSLIGPATGLNLQETIWLLKQVRDDRQARATRLEYLLGKRKRDRLFRLYVE